VRFLVDYVRVPPGFDNLLLAVVLGLAFLTMPLTVTMMRRYGKRNTYMISMAFMAVVLFIMGQTPPGGQNMILVAAIFAGLGYGAAQAVPWAIVADVIEADELKTGKRREGIYYGYLVFFRKLASAFAIFLVGQILAASGFVTSTMGSVFVEQPQSALIALRFLVGGLPIVMLGLAIVAAWRYPLDREQYEAIKVQLERKRSQRKRHQKKKNALR
jgi:GPH family glycoside/pentoside/hexuronide:cation symporter